MANSSSTLLIDNPLDHEQPDLLGINDYQEALIECLKTSDMPITIALQGEWGSGKTSFLKTLYAELPLAFGEAEVAGFQLKKILKSQIPLLRRKCGMAFQDFKLLIDRNVYKNLEF